MSFPRETKAGKDFFRRALTLLTLLASCQQNVWAQEPEVGTGAPPAAVGQDAGTLGGSENPPVSSIDQPSLEPRTGPRNLLQPAVIVTESVDTNIGNSLGTATANGVTRVFGSLLLDRLWRHYQTGVAYLGGGSLYWGVPQTGNAIQGLDAQQRIGWRTGQFTVRDAFSYLPDGGFLARGAYGLGGISGGFPGVGIPGFFNATQFGSLGRESHVTNVVLSEVVQGLSPRSAVTVSGGFGLLHFFNNTSGFIASDTASFLAAYDRQLTRKDQVAVAYGFVHFGFPNLSQTSAANQAGTSIRNQVVTLIYGRQVSGRMTFRVAAGPQFAQIFSPTQPTSTLLNAYVNALLDYRLSRAALSLNYTHRNTSGSGFSLGAQTDVVTLDLARPISRSWQFSTDAGFSRNKSIIAVTVNQGITPNTFDSFFAGASLHHRLGRRLSGFLSYQFSDQIFNGAACKNKGACSTQRQVATLGLQWHPRPIRLE